MKRYLAEFTGTFILVYFAVGGAVFGIDKIGAVGVALTFGLLMVALAYGIGPVSGSQLNPAVTLGMLLARRMTAAEAGRYAAAQVLGGVAAAGVLKLTVVTGAITDQTRGFGSAGFDGTVNAAGAFVVEALLTALLVLIFLLVTDGLVVEGFAGLAIGLTLAAVQLVGIPLTGASVNPARSIGPALFAGGERLGKLWLLVLAPLVGGVLAALLAPRLHRSRDAGQNVS